jgi:flagellar basal body-associated protein FliL
MNKNKRDSILAIVIFVVVVLAVIGFVIFGVLNDKKNKQNSNEILKLISENVIDFENHDFTSEDIKYKYRPNTHDNIILVHYWNDKWYAYDVDGIKIENIKTKEDLEKVDIIAFAISEFYSKDYVYANTTTKVKLSTEKVTIYLYNPKEKRVFIQNTLPAKELPKSTSSSVNYKHSIYEIKERIRKNYGAKSKSTGKVIAIIMFVLIGVFVIYRVVVTIKNSKNDKYKYNKYLKRE